MKFHLLLTLLLLFSVPQVKAATPVNGYAWLYSWQSGANSKSSSPGGSPPQSSLGEFKRELEEAESIPDQVIIDGDHLMPAFSSAVEEVLQQMAPLYDYETQVPRATQPDISRREKRLLGAYLDRVDHAGLAQLLALYHLKRSLLRDSGGQAIKHTILAQYFLHRSLDLGRDKWWIRKSLQATEAQLHQWFETRRPHNDAADNADENHPAHIFFREIFFNNHEGDRFIALEKLLDDFAEHPRNMLTNTYLTTVNIWMGGEADYDDPTVLYHFVLSSYFSVRARYLAEERETLWRENPNEHSRFRLATLIGGWTVPARRWLARLHGDDTAVQRLDAEHNHWLAINTAFVSVPVGLMLFEENDKFAEGFAAWEAGRDYCDKVSPTDLSCIDWPRASFNILSFVLGEVDFYLKSGQLAVAESLLSLRHIPNEYFAESFAVWDIGREAWLHREQNLEQIAALYQNEDPGDDPSHFLLKQHRWGPGTFICQVCHQRQSKEWPEGEVERVLSWTDEIPPVGEGNWPPVSTSWYGSSTSVGLSL
ncbi:hypothetical protein GCM10011348_26740 [Marinobacterium nitratireducens]|uniref:DUF4034 domain-containing protein n=1 Tax=Marinobacterium nitratireducens TaxID=518897 RepID=A0A917ZH59_9GAMM|nr:hypothetical protein [Marinobacterium nitratireducens]GGO83300.1 hypothetical protein GCM10011348_26740 [Marinobacterium nitratireducens]